MRAKTGAEEAAIQKLERCPHGITRVDDPVTDSTVFCHGQSRITDAELIGTIALGCGVTSWTVQLSAWVSSLHDEERTG